MWKTQISLVTFLIVWFHIYPTYGMFSVLPYGYVSRSDWNAKLPKHILRDVHEPVSIVIIAHTHTTMCDTPDDQIPCPTIVRLIQEIHLNRTNHYDIGYNFLIGGDGQVYEGRGWFTYGVHTEGYNDKSRAIAFIGRYNEEHEEPTMEQVDAALALIQQGISLGILKDGYRLYGQRTLVKTDSPGDVLFDIIKHWVGFSEVK